MGTLSCLYKVIWVLGHIQICRLWVRHSPCCTLFFINGFVIEMVMCDLYLKRFDMTKGLLFDTFSITVWYKLCRYDHSKKKLRSARFCEIALRTVLLNRLINLLIRINSGPNILRSYFLHWLSRFTVCAVYTAQQFLVRSDSLASTEPTREGLDRYPHGLVWVGVMPDYDTLLVRVWANI